MDGVRAVLGHQIRLPRPQRDIKADIEGQTIVINGNIEGNINASNMVCVGDAAVVNGTIKAPNIETSDGAKINGNVIMAKFHPEFKDLEI